jgi:hypothetical protein
VTGVTGATGVASTLTITAIPSVDQTGTGIIIGLTYGASCTLGNPLYLASDGTVKPADADGSGTYPVMGIALATASSGTNNVLLFGVYRDDTNYNFTTVGGIVYFSTTTGAVTQTQPSSPDNAIQVIGIATAQRRLLFIAGLDVLTHV